MKKSNLTGSEDKETRSRRQFFKKSMDRQPQEWRSCVRLQVESHLSRTCYIGLCTGVHDWKPSQQLPCYTEKMEVCKAKLPKCMKPTMKTYGFADVDTVIVLSFMEPFKRTRDSNGVSEGTSVPNGDQPSSVTDHYCDDKKRDCCTSHCLSGHQKTRKKFSFQ